MGLVMKNLAVAIDKFIKNLNLSKIQYLYPEKDNLLIANDVFYRFSPRPPNLPPAELVVGLGDGKRCLIIGISIKRLSLS